MSESQMPTADRFEIRFKPTAGAIGLMIANAFIALGFFLMARDQAGAGAVIFRALGTFMALAVIGNLWLAGTRRLVASIDRDGVVMPRIKDERFRRWSWDEVEAIVQFQQPGYRTNFDALRFALLPSPRVAAFTESMPERSWFRGRKKQLEDAMSIIFYIGVRPNRAETLRRVSVIQPRLLGPTSG